MTSYFRIALGLALILVTHLTTTAHAYPGTDTVNDKLAHVVTFLVLAFLADFSFPRSEFGSVKVLSLLVYGLGIEIVQYFLPERTFSLFDLAGDGLGLAAYVGLVPLLRRVPALAFRWKN
ncbi:MAG: VanZ family protein [Gammaproteobacteria bacterium]|nr:VanZ family protein [Gammaproteobacteria bacterium]